MFVVEIYAAIRHFVFIEGTAAGTLPGFSISAFLA